MNAQWTLTFISAAALCVVEFGYRAQACCEIVSDCCMCNFQARNFSAIRDEDFGLGTNAGIFRVLKTFCNMFKAI